MEREKLVELLKGLGMTDEEVGNVTDAEVVEMCKHLSADTTEDALRTVLSDADVQAAIEGDDVAGFSTALKKAVATVAKAAKSAKDEDEEDKDGEDEDEDDDDKDKQQKKGLAEYFEDGDEVGDMIDADVLLKSVMGAAQDRQDDRIDRLEAIVRKGMAGVGAKVDSALTALEQMGAKPAGRRMSALAAVAGPLDDRVGGGETVNLAEVNDVILKAQADGDITGAKASEIMGAARVGGTPWATHLSDFEEIRATQAKKE